MTFRDLYSFCRYRGLKSEVVDDVHAKVDLFGKKDPLRANLHKCFPKGFIVTQIRVLCANFMKFGRPEVREIARCLPDKKTTKFLLALACARIAPTICQGQLQTIYSECPKFHPNPFTSSGVTAEHVNVIETRHSVSNTRRSYSLFTE